MQIGGYHQMTGSIRITVQQGKALPGAEDHQVVSIVQLLLYITEDAAIDFGLNKLHPPGCQDPLHLVPIVAKKKPIGVQNMACEAFVNMVIDDTVDSL